MIEELLLKYFIPNVHYIVPTIVVLLVMWNFWGNSWITEKIGGLSKKQKGHVDKVLEETKIEER